ncbi:YiiX family permuted papain-like enzyme [Flavobacterium silvaticum]|uniref:YiiX family permuted papain-like enzyme n=1 Tax=Flavobacterium silvaticum TaxID=1852020 RepID=UPI001B7CF1CD|nr:YiiX family permuted papain-like enzyme [Flavobacterium silvaticum]
MLLLIIGCKNETHPPKEWHQPKKLEKVIKDGDIIFQTSLSSQSEAIQRATHSKYSHCGLLFKRKYKNDEWCVLEAVQPVKWTPLSSWIKRGKGKHYVIKRLTTDPMIPDSMLAELREIAESYIGKDYDLYFDWSDKNVYCSELIWKSYYKLNRFEIGKLQRLGDFDLSDKVVKQKLMERYGTKIPANELVISPDAIFNSGLLKTVKTN